MADGWTELNFWRMSQWIIEFLASGIEDRGSGIGGRGSTIVDGWMDSWIDGWMDGWND